MRCLHHVNIAFLFIPFQHLRLEQEQILLDLFWACRKLSSDTITFDRGKAVKQAEEAFKVAMQPSERKNHNKSFCANVSQLLNKAKDCQKCKILLEIGKQRNSVGDEFARKSCCIWAWQFCCCFKRKRMWSINESNESMSHESWVMSHESWVMSHESISQWADLKNKSFAVAIWPVTGQGLLWPAVDWAEKSSKCHKTRFRLLSPA